MNEIIEVIKTNLALIISILALVASAVFYFKSTRQLRDSTQRLQRTMNVLGNYLKATIKDARVDLIINKKGDIVGLNISGHAELHAVGQLSVKGIKGNMRPD